MSIRKTLIITFFSFILILSGCFSTDSDNDSDDNDKTPIDTIPVLTALDSLASLGANVDIDSSMLFSKNETIFKMWDLGASADDTIQFVVAISGSNSSLTINEIDSLDTIIVTMNTKKIIGTGTTFDESAWQLTSISLNAFDTLVSYTLLDSEIVAFYLSSGKAYMVESGTNMDKLFDTLENSIEIPIDETTILDTLAILAGTTEIDSAMVYIKNGSIFTLLESDTIDNDTISFTTTISSGTAAMVMQIIEEGDTITVTINTGLIVGDGLTFDGSAWQVTSVSMNAMDTTVSLTLSATEIIAFYLNNGTSYMIQNGSTMDSIFNELGNSIVGGDPIDSTKAIDTLASLVTSSGIDSMMTYSIIGDTITMLDAIDTMVAAFDLTSGELSLIFSLDKGVLVETFKLVAGTAGDIDGGVWQLSSMSVTIGASTETYTLQSNEVVALYLNNGKIYEVEENVDFEAIVDELILKAEGFGNPTGTWYVKYFETMNVWNNGIDTSVDIDSLINDTVYTIVEITSSSLKTYDYDDSLMVIEVTEQMIDVSAGGIFEFSSDYKMIVKEKSGELEIVIVEDRTNDGGDYNEEVLTCYKYTGTVPPAYWTVDTTVVSSAKLLATDGTIDTASIDSMEEVDQYKFIAEAGNVYQIVVGSESDNAGIDMDVYYFDGTLKTFIYEDEREVMIKTSSAMTYYIDVYSNSDSIEYTISVKEITVIATPTEAVNNWYCSAMPISPTDSLKFLQDSSIFYATLSADSIKIYLMNNGVKETMTDAIFFSPGNKCYFFGEEFDYTLSATTMGMVGSDMSFVWTVFTGVSFPPEKFVDFGILKDMGGRYSRLLK